MKCSFYLDRPYNPTVDAETLKAELKLAKEKNKALAKKYFNPKPTSVYLFFSPDKNTRIKYRTSLKVIPSDWDFKAERLKSTAVGAMAFNTDLQDLSNDIIKKVYLLKQEKSIISSLDIKNIISVCIDKKTIVTETSQLETLIKAFIDYKKRYTTSGTIQEYNTVFKALRDYQTKKGLSLSLGDFDKKFFSNFEDFLSNKENPKDENRGLLNDTIYKYIATLRVFLAWCQETGNDVNPEGLKKHKSPYKRKSHNEIVVLTETELMSLLEYDLSARPAYERVRDVFCFACFTGQRYSDVARFNKKDFKDNKWTFQASAVSRVRI